MNIRSILELLAFEKSWIAVEIEEGDPDELLSKKSKWLEFKLCDWSHTADEVMMSLENLSDDDCKLLMESLSRAVGSILAFRKRDIPIQIPEEFRKSAQKALVGSEDRVTSNVYRVSRMLEVAIHDGGNFSGEVTVDESGKVFSKDGERIMSFDPKRILKNSEDLRAGKGITLKQIQEKKKAAMNDIKAIAFDVFGTLLDWKGTIISSGERLMPNRPINWEKFANAWMQSYGESLARLKENNTWAPLDSLLEASYEKLALEFGLDACSDLKRSWSRLDPFPDASKGLDRLKDKFHLAALTNANASMLESLADHSKLPWRSLLSAESVKRYKPDPEIYRMAIEKLGLQPHQILMVASHTFDLNAANEAGMKTGLISRRGEPGSSPVGLNHGANLVVGDAEELAEYLLS